MPRTKDVPLPSDSTVLVTIKKLTWTQKKGARQQAVIASAKDLVAMGGKPFMDAMKAMQTDEPKPETERDPLLSYDQLSVLVSGIESWTKPEPVSKQAIEDLDEVDADGLARAILALTLPDQSEASVKTDA